MGYVVGFDVGVCGDYLVFMFGSEWSGGCGAWVIWVLVVWLENNVGGGWYFWGDVFVFSGM